MEIIKDVITTLLILLCIVLVLSIFLYDKVALSKVVPETEEYALSKKMQEDLENPELDETQEVIVNYYIDASDLNKYEKTNEYNKGRNNPFAVVQKNTSQNNNTNNTSTDKQNNVSQNFYEDNGTK